MNGKSPLVTFAVLLTLVWASAALAGLAAGGKAAGWGDVALSLGPAAPGPSGSFPRADADRVYRHRGGRSFRLSLRIGEISGARTLTLYHTTAGEGSQQTKG